MLTYKSTRGGEEGLSDLQAILQGLASDGGLLVPESIPELDLQLSDLPKLSYYELAVKVLSLWFPSFSEDELTGMVTAAYKGRFNSDKVVPLSSHGNIHYLELFHGQTLAFKDVALSLLPRLMTAALKKTGSDETVYILTATSGDTGKAAMEGFADVPGTRIVVFYPETGVSPVQKQQMVTQRGDNLAVVGINGNFDDAQASVKQMMDNPELRQLLKDNNARLSSANSINVGRLVPQIVYYFYAYGQLLKKGEIVAGDKIDVAVPTGNFGNILAAWYASQMGLPVNRFICASNRNKVLTDFLNTGVYDRRRDFYVTSSPSMDILVSSNLERLLYHLSGDKSTLITDLMNRLKSDGLYEVPAELKERLSSFRAGHADDMEAEKAINEFYKEYGYVIDPHTAVGYHVYQQLCNDAQDGIPVVIASTASPFKFTSTVYHALFGEQSEYNDFELIDQLAKRTGLNVPETMLQIANDPVLHTQRCEIEEMLQVVRHFIKKHSK